MDTKSIAYQNSELISQSNSPVLPKPGSQNWLKRIGKFLVEAFTQIHEVKIRQIIDRNGNVSWEVSDPRTQETLWFYSEAEVRVWLDQRLG